MALGVMIYLMIGVMCSAAFFWWCEFEERVYPVSE